MRTVTSDQKFKRKKNNRLTEHPRSTAAFNQHPNFRISVSLPQASTRPTQNCKGVTAERQRLTKSAVTCTKP